MCQAKIQQIDVAGSNAVSTQASIFIENMDAFRTIRHLDFNGFTTKSNQR